MVLFQLLFQLLVVILGEESLHECGTFDLCITQIHDEVPFVIAFQIHLLLFVSNVAVVPKH